MAHRLEHISQLFKQVFAVLSSALALLSLIYPIPEAKAGEYAQGVGLGIHFFTGAATGSLTGSRGYSVNFGAEKNKGFLRPSLSAVIQYSTGTASVSSSSSTYTLYEADFMAGFKIFALQAGSIQPFLGADGIIGSGTLKLPVAVGETAANTLGLSYGFAINMGVNISRSASGAAVRLQGQYCYLSSTLAGTTAFDLGGFRFTAGIVF